MRPPRYVKLYVHNATVPRAYQISSLRKGEAPNCYGFYTYLAYIKEPEHSPTPKPRAQVKNHLRIVRRVNPL